VHATGGGARPGKLMELMREINSLLEEKERAWVSRRPRRHRLDCTDTVINYAEKEVKDEGTQEDFDSLEDRSPRSTKEASRGSENTRAPHTNIDAYDHVLEDDLKRSAAVAASLIYQIAMRDERIPPKPLPPID
jgi:hypothetical protein